MADSPTPHRKRYLPLESNPEVFTQLIRNLGVHSLEFVDVYSLDEPDLLAMVPRPVLAVVMVFPVSETYEQHRRQNDADRPDYSGGGPDEDVIWYKQTIHNACGLYGILHAVSNGNARNFITPDSAFAQLLEKCTSLDPEGRARYLEESAPLEEAHTRAANQGDSAVPALEDEVDFHYVCFAPSHKREGRIFELDGRRNCPIETPVTVSDGDVLGEGGIGLVKDFIKREQGANQNFSLMALVASDA